MDSKLISAAENGERRLAHLEQDTEAARTYLKAARSGVTVRAYQRAWMRFQRWCEERGLVPMPAAPGTVALYVAGRAKAGTRPATIDKDLAAISYVHRGFGEPSPCSEQEVREVRQGMRRTLGTAQVKKAPLTVGELRAISRTLPTSLIGLRDRAVLMLGFAAALRRSELAALEVRDLEVDHQHGLILTIRRSKTDQEGRGAKVGVPYGQDLETCPVRTVQMWMATAGIEEGAVFRPVSRHGHVSRWYISGRSIARIVKRAAAAAGLDPDRFSGHSLRAGFVTSALRAGRPEHVVMRQTRHQSIAVFRGYARESDLFRDNAAAGLL